MAPFVLSNEQLPPPRRSLAPKLGNKAHAQAQSALFTAVPPEIRNRIFSIALTAYDDKSKPYQRQNWFYRPGWHAHPKISTTLLLTCKRVYLECHLLPLAINSHTLWASAERGPPPHYFASANKKRLPSGRGRQLGNWNASENFRGFFNKLTAEQRGAVGQLHFFFQQSNLEAVKFSPPLDPDSSRPIAAKKLKVTMRHQDWGIHGGERFEKLGLCPWNRGRTFWYQMDTPMPKTMRHWLSSQGWGAQLRYVQGLEEFELELETLVERKWEMDGIVERAKRWIFPLKEDKFLRWDSGTGVRESRWEEDDVQLNGEVPSPAENLGSAVFALNADNLLTVEHVALLDGSRCLHRTVMDDSLSQCSNVAEPNGRSREVQIAKRQYYVVSLTWKVRAGEEEEMQSSPSAAIEWSL